MTEDEGDRLYGLSLDEFTQARDALAARLKRAGDAAAAAAVKALKKPTTPAWAVDQLARRQRPLVEELIEASDRLRRAQQDLLAGGSAQGVWEATLAERDIVGRLIHEAERILEGQGYGAARATTDRVADTLTAAAADPAALDALRRGVLAQEMRRAGFGGLLGAGADVAESKPRVRAAKPERPQRKATPPRASEPERRKGPTPREVLDAEREATRMHRAADRAEDEAVRREREAAKALAESHAARKRLDAAERDAARIRADAAAARKEANAAQREAERAAARLDKVRSSRRG